MGKLQFVRGRAYADLDKFLANAIVEDESRGSKDQVFYLVPEHLKFESEMTMLNHFHKHEKYADQEYIGMLQVQVFSFNRLAWYLMQNSAIFKRSQLTQTGLTMLVQSVLFECVDDLTIYKGLTNQKGFVSKLADLFKELRGASLTAEDFESFIEGLDQNNSRNVNRALKFQDIQLIYSRYLEALIGKYIEAEDIIEALIAYVEDGNLSDATIYVNHFYTFNPQEMRLLKAFMQHTKGLTVAFLLDEGNYAIEIPNKTHIFFQTASNYHYLYQMARELHLPVQNDQIVSPEETYPVEELDQIEAYWYDSNRGMTSQSSQPNGVDMSTSDAVVIYEAENKQAEAKHTANEIRRLVKKDGYRFQDIVVLSRDISEYEHILQPIFERNDIPIYVSTSRSMSSHPLVEFIRSLLNILKNNWRYQDVMTLLKTDLIQPIESAETIRKQNNHRYLLNKLVESFRPKVDLTENVVLAYGYQGNDWTKKEDWEILPRDTNTMLYSDKEKETEQTANEVRNFLRRELVPFYKRLDKAETNKEAANVLYDFLEYLYIPDLLLAWRDDAVANGELEKSQQHEQVWEAFINLLDEFVEILGDNQWSLEQLLDIFEIGFLNAEYNNIPATLDQVILTDLTRLSATKDKVVFILGLTDQALPLYSENTTLLTDQEREYINSQNEEGMQLLQDTYQKVTAEPFVAYQAFTQASEKLYLVYPKLDNDNKQLKSSPYLNRLQQQFNLPVIQLVNHPKPEGEVSDQLHFIGGEMETFALAVEVLSQGRVENIPPNTFWLALYKEIISRNKQKDLFNLVNDSLNYKNTTVNLSSDTAEKLYGSDLYLSVSEIESYYKDPFSHFLNYGLKLQERETIDIDPRKAGNYYHDVMDQLVSYLIEKGQSITEYDTDDKLFSLADKILDKVFENPTYFYLNRNNRNKMVKSLFKETLYAMAWAMREQSKLTLAKPLQTEVVFGPYSGENTIEGLIYPLSNGGKLQVRGKIDRIDEIKQASSDDTYLGVVDYKSSDNKLNYERIYHGLQIQLLTYLLVANKQRENSKPAYALYEQVKNPLVEVKDHKKFNLDYVKEEFLKTFKQSGLIVDNDQLLDTLAVRLDDSTYSPVYQIKTNKNGLVTINGGIHLPENDMQTVFDYVEGLIVNAGNKILSGDTRLMPFEDEVSESTKKEYRPISQFDILLGENTYRTYDKLDEASFLKRIKKEGEDDDE